MIKKAINGIKKIYNNDKPLIIEWIMVGIISFIILFPSRRYLYSLYMAILKI